MIGGRWRPSAYRLSHGAHGHAHVSDPRQWGRSESSDARPIVVPWTDERPISGGTRRRRSWGCVAWLLVAATLALPTAVLILSLAQRAWR